MMRRVLGLAVSAAVVAAAAFTAAASEEDAPDFTVSVQFHPGKAAGTGEVAVTFEPRDAEVRINATPAPRLKLDPGQKLLAQKVGARPNVGPATDKYLDTTFPVVFPVAVLSRPRGEQSVKASLVYYYCSHREGWCRKGTSDFEIPLKAR